MTIQCCNKLSTKGFLGLDLFSDFNIFNNCADLDLNIAGFFDGPLGTKCGYNVACCRNTPVSIVSYEQELDVNLNPG